MEQARPQRRCPCDSVGAKDLASVSHTCTRKTIVQSMHDPFDLLEAEGQVEVLRSETIFFLSAGDKTIHRGRGRRRGIPTGTH